DESAGHVPGCASEEAGDDAQPRRDARLEAAAGHDADPVPLPRRARAQSLPEWSRVRGRPLEALAARIPAALRADGAARAAGNRLGPDSRWKTWAEVVSAPGAPPGRVGSRGAPPAAEPNRHL